MGKSDWRQLARDEINNKTKPHGALGELEELAVKLAMIQKTLNPRVYPACVLIFGADHGVAKQGVSAYPPQVTTQMMANFANGGAAINVISKSVNASIVVIDVGVASDLSDFSGIAQEKVNAGTNDFSKKAAMTHSQCEQAISIGSKYAEDAHKQGFRTLALGEMGIGNTTSASAVICAITNLSVKQIVGLGTGIDDRTLLHKRSIVDKALILHKNNTKAPKDILMTLGGFEIAAIVGAMLRGYELGLVILVDGFISTAAALVACEIKPAVRDHLIFSHQSAENGHKLALDHLKATPLLNLGLRLGEGTGAALCIPIINAAARILGEMATFEQASVSAKN